MIRSDRINHLAHLCKAKRYLEIGVCEGTTFFQVTIPYKVAVDPIFRFDFNSKIDRRTNFYQMSSDDFFEQYDGGSFDLIYLDGLHTFDQTTRDFFNSLKFAHNKTIWIIDDTVPNDAFSADPNMERCFELRKKVGVEDWAWMGDVFKTVFLIERTLPSYHFRTFTGHGQTVVWRETRLRNLAAKSVGLESIGSMTYLDMVSHRETMHFESDDQIFEAVARVMKAG